MRILTIGLSGLPSGENSTFLAADVLQDYDAMVIDTDSIETLFGYEFTHYKYEDKMILETGNGEALLRQSVKRRSELHGFLRKGGIVVVFIRPIKKYTYGKNSYVTNYDWLYSRSFILNELNISGGTGNTINNLDSNHPFYEYLKLKPSWSAFADISSAVENEWQILASAWDTHALSLFKKVETGFIILIPSFYSSDNGEILESCIENILTIDEPSRVPDWVTPIIVPGQEILHPKLSELNESIVKLQDSTKRIETNIQDLEKWKMLLYEKGKHYLEPIVRNALSLVGFNDKSRAEQIADGFFSCEYGDAILEVEGSNESIKIEKISQLIRDRANYSEDKKCTSPKGILVGNPFREEPLENRPPKNTNKLLFTKELVETAEKQDIVVLLSTDLYDIVSLILENKMSDAQKHALRKRIFESTGQIKLV